MSDLGSVGRPTRALIDLEAVAANVRTLRERAGVEKFCAVVKADGYGHGAVEVSQAAISVGATHLGVATTDEAAALRSAKIEVPILLLSTPPAAEFERVVALELEPFVYDAEAVTELSSVAGKDGATVGVHVHLDTGMSRVGADPDLAVDLVTRVAELPGVYSAGISTHFATSEEGADGFTGHQLERFGAAVDACDKLGLDVGIRHAANSGAVITMGPSAGFDMVRCGIATYGIPPDPSVSDLVPLEPVMTLETHVHRCYLRRAGSTISYGRRHTVAADTWIATLPIGYADGVPRRLTGACDALINGRRFPVVGTITMDQIMVDVGSEPVEQGTPVTLIGRSGSESITALDWATELGTIGYEITCGIGPRVPRFYT